MQRKNNILLIILLVFSALILIAGYGYLYFLSNPLVVGTPKKIATVVTKPQEKKKYTVDDYMVISPEPILTSKDTIEQKYWSPDKEHYLSLIIKSGRRIISLYKSKGMFVFAFDPVKSEDFHVTGVTRRFHDYWVDNDTIAFNFMDDSGTDRISGSFYYHISANKLSKIEDNFFDFDNKRGFLMKDVLDANWEKPRINVSYINKSGEVITLGEINGFLNGLSPSGEYAIYLSYFRQNINNNPSKNESVAYTDAYIFPVLKNGVNKAIKLGEIAQYEAGYQPPISPVFTKWIDKERVVIPIILGTLREKEFNNPFIK